MIYNVIITKALFETITNSIKLVFFKDFKATNSIQNKTTIKKSQKNIYKNIIVYGDDLAITTTNFDEISDILTTVSNSFPKFS